MTEKLGVGVILGLACGGSKVPKDIERNGSLG